MATPQRPTWPVRADDARGLGRLGVEAVLGVVGMVEQLHHTIGRVAPPLGAPSEGPARGLSGWVYGAVRGTTRAVGLGLDRGLGWLAPHWPEARDSARREALLAVLNGVVGDHLAATANPLAIPMRWRHQGRPVESTPEAQAQAWPDAGPNLMVLLHGLCMNDLQWDRDNPHDLPTLGRELGYTVVRLHYNSGEAIGTNAEALAERLEQLLAAWPVPVQRLALVGHSMGGLLARGACHAAAQAGMAWPARLQRLVCLGTPHHGARLERGGHGLERLLGLSPYAAPFARLGAVRSAGITDLRHGRVRAPAPGEGELPDPTPLPAGVAVGLLAATTAERARGWRHALVGDGLVTLDSAWGEHRDPARALAVPPSGKALITRADHWDLLAHPEAAAVLRRWLR